MDSIQERPARGRTSQPSNPYLRETYERYESPPFRQVQLDDQDLPLGNAPLYGTRSPRQGASNENRKSSSSILNRILSRQTKLEQTINKALLQQGGGPAPGARGGPNVQRDGSAVQRWRSQRQRDGYSLAGPPANGASNEDGTYTDPDYQRPEDESGPVWGLSKPFPHVNRRGKSKKNKSQKGRPENEFDEAQQNRGEHPRGQVGGGPAGHRGAGDPVQGDPEGEAPGGPATNPRRQEQEGSDDFITHFADGLAEPSTDHRRDSPDTLIGDKDAEGSDDEEEEEIPNYWFSIRRRLREPFAEFLASMVLVMLGTCGNLQVKVSQGDAGSYTQEAMVWGFATMISIYIAGGISGAHCNPTVSIFLHVFRGFPARKALYYILAQILGAIVGVLIAFYIYKDAIFYFDPALSASSKGVGTAFYTLPNTFVRPTEAFFTDFLSSAVQAGAVLAVGDDSNAPPGAGMHAFIIGLIAFVLASTLGYNTGPQTNPSKDFATRLITWLLGFESGMWQRAWWAEAWSASVGGGLFGAFVYDLLIFEGAESPINFPRVKRKQARTNKKRRWNLWGKLKGREGRTSDEQVALEKGDLER